MRLARPFYRLPVRFDAARLHAEVQALPPAAWARHPNDIAGNSAVRLISVGGGENDDVNGVMKATPHLKQSPYMRQVLAGFGVVWSRSRLLKLAAGATVPEHADINYHWFNRVRMHIPITTRAEVRFHCGDQSVHMAAGEAWIFDNWRPHHVENPTQEERVHLVADTSGTAAFWQLVGAAERVQEPARTLAFDSAQDAMPLMECAVLAPVMTPGEVDLLVLDLRSELILHNESTEGRGQLARYHALLEAMCRDWRQLYVLYGSNAEGWARFTTLRDSLRAASSSLGDGIVMRTNGVAAHSVLEGRVLRAMLSLPAQKTSDSRTCDNLPGTNK